MSRIHRKSSELVQAQIAAYTAENVTRPTSALYLYSNIGKLSASEVVDVTDKKRLIASGDDYAAYIKNTHGSNHEPIATRKSLLTNYKGFAPLARKLKGQIEEVSPNEHPDYLGSGKNMHAFLVPNDGGEYVVKIPRGRIPKPDDIDRRIQAAILGKEIPGLERLTAASYVDNIIVAEKMAGRPLGKVPVDSLTNITDKQLEGLISTLQMANNKGMVLDLSAEDLFYDEQKGFGIIDYHPGIGGQQKLKEVYLAAMDTLGGAGLFDPPPQTFGDFTNIQEQLLKRASVLERFRELGKLDELIEDNGAAKISGFYRLRTKNYGDPQWVSREMGRIKKGGKPQPTYLELKEKEYFDPADPFRGMV